MGKPSLMSCFTKGHIMCMHNILMGVATLEYFGIITDILAHVSGHKSGTQLVETNTP